ncbi:MAG: transglycosylase domain-containing protein [Oscillospiraceae bacterium]|nr:transglycosylase domain-containing protein [Oscillospiraceae bacterium]
MSEATATYRSHNRSRKNEPKKPRSLTSRIVIKIVEWFFIILGSILLIAVLAALVALIRTMSYVSDEIMPQAEEMQDMLESQSVNSNLTSTIYYTDAEGNEQVMDTLYGSENRVWIAYEDIPEDLINATIAIEDKRFWEHEGVDWTRTAAAVMYMFTGGDIQGGSTITQQLVKNLSGNTDVTVQRKIVEIFAALTYDSNHTKEEILENYLNYIYLGRQCYGVYTAAYKYFNKDVSDLSLAECACLISITNNPSLYDPYTNPENNKARAAAVLKQMYVQDLITQDQELEAMAEIGYLPNGEKDEDGYDDFTYHADQDKLQFYSGSSQTLKGETSEDNINSWYEDSLMNEVKNDLMTQYGLTAEEASNMLYHGGLNIYSCYDESVQSIVDEVYTAEDFLAGYTSTKGQELLSAITVVENTTGRVVAIADSEEKTVNRGQVNATDATRQPGSSIKPLSVYSPALEEGLITPYSAVEDSPVMELEDGTEWPKNATDDYIGDTDIYYGVTRSVNTIAVKTLDKLGVETSFSYLQDRFGISTLVAGYRNDDGEIITDKALAALGLGGLTDGVTTYEMAGAYSTFARNGVFIKPHMYTVVLDDDGKTILSNAENEMGTQILSDSTVYYMNLMLNGVVKEGTGTGAAINGMTVAGKTGTTSNSYDLWFCGFTGYYTAAVWTGYNYSEEIHFNASPAVAAWRSVMVPLVEGKEDIPLVTTDEQLVKVEYCKLSGELPVAACRAAGTVTSAEFIDGTQPTDTCSVHGAGTKVEYAATQSVLGVQSEYEKPVGSVFALCAYSQDSEGNEGGKISYTSNNTQVARVTSSGVVTLSSPGTAVITISAAGTENAEAVSFTTTITVTDD